MPDYPNSYWHPEWRKVPTVAQVTLTPSIYMGTDALWGPRSNIRVTHEVSFARDKRTTKRPTLVVTSVSLSVIQHRCQKLLHHVSVCTITGECQVQSLNLNVIGERRTNAAHHLVKVTGI